MLRGRPGGLSEQERNGITYHNRHFNNSHTSPVVNRFTGVIFHEVEGVTMDIWALFWVMLGGVLIVGLAIVVMMMLVIAVYVLTR